MTRIFLSLNCLQIKLRLHWRSIRHKTQAAATEVKQSLLTGSNLGADLSGVPYKTSPLKNTLAYHGRISTIFQIDPFLGLISSNFLGANVLKLSCKLDRFIAMQQILLVCIKWPSLQKM
jgi:hypothetical protein